jgi:Protein of unknown function (DUF1504).
MPQDSIQLAAAAIFAVALCHTFAAKQLERLAARLPRHAGLFHLLGEVEVVFGFWAIVLVGFIALGPGETRRSPTPNRATTPSRCSSSS